jgi:hypothetical protein
VPRKEPKYEIIVDEDDEPEETGEVEQETKLVSKKERRKKKMRAKEKWTMKEHTEKQRDEMERTERPRRPTGLPGSSAAAAPPAAILLLAGLILGPALASLWDQ